jgi:hypothetical protein
MRGKIAMTPHPLNSGLFRVRRAEEHLTELRTILNQIAMTYQNTIRAKLHPKTSDEIQILVPKEALPAPAIAPIIIGEICYNLRCALDYLVFELARLDSGRSPQLIQFPIEYKREVRF